MRVSVMPSRLRFAPCDAVAFDVWQDREGLLDASKACRQAWRSFERSWRAVRRHDLAPQEDGAAIEWSLTPEQQHIARRARELGAAHALCRATHEIRPLSARRRRAWMAWRSRCQRADLTAWQALWSLLDGEPLGVVAARYSESPERLEKKVCKLFQWLKEELHISTVF